MNVKRGKYRLAQMKSRAGAGRLPVVNIVEMRDGSIYSKDLLEAIKLRLERGEQTVLFLNRRGYSRSMSCACGFVSTCPHCDIPFTYHKVDNCLRCHVCGAWEMVPKCCPECSSTRFSCEGIGTQRAQDALKKCFPQAGILRMDADSTSRKHSHDDILGAFRRREADILLGTQMIAKGLDFPNVTLVGVLNADASLNMADFRAEERTFQLLSQVSGRAGRSELPGEVFIQTRDPYARTIRFAAKGNFAEFAESELAGRQECFLPPFCHLSALTIKAKDANVAQQWAVMYATSLKAYSKQVKGLMVGEATPGVLAKADGWYRWQIVLRSQVNSTILGAWKWICLKRPPSSAVRVAIDVDAMNLV
jgi:primosomal protein N' (replication factor Y)